MKRSFTVHYQRQIHGPYFAESEAAMVAGFEAGQRVKLTHEGNAVYRTSKGARVVFVVKPISDLAIHTLKCAVEEHVRPSYMRHLRECVDAGLVTFANNGVGAPILSDAGRAAIASLWGAS